MTLLSWHILSWQQFALEFCAGTSFMPAVVSEEYIHIVAWSRLSHVPITVWWSNCKMVQISLQPSSSAVRSLTTTAVSKWKQGVLSTHKMHKILESIDTAMEFGRLAPRPNCCDDSVGTYFIGFCSVFDNDPISTEKNIDKLAITKIQCLPR